MDLMNGIFKANQSHRTHVSNKQYKVVDCNSFNKALT